MKKIMLKNKKISDILLNLSKKVFSNIEEIMEEYTTEERDCEIIPEYRGYQDQYLNKAMEFDIKEFGFPRSAIMIGKNDSQKLRSLTKPETLKLMRKLGANANALTALYPENGYIGWHHNGNAPGYNILFSYSIDGNGRFKYYDYDTKSIIKIEDEQGWNVKVGYYPNELEEPERVYWHSAETNKPRLSVAFIVNDRNIWESMINDISMGDYDKDMILSQGPKSEN